MSSAPKVSQSNAQPPPPLELPLETKRRKNLIATPVRCLRKVRGAR